MYPTRECLAAAKACSLWSLPFLWNVDMPKQLPPTPKLLKPVIPFCLFLQAQELLKPWARLPAIVTALARLNGAKQ